MVNNPGSPLANKAGVALVTQVGLSYTFPTKTTTAALAALLGLAAEMGAVLGRIDQASYQGHMHELGVLVPATIEASLDQPGFEQAARLLQSRRQLVVVGSGATRAAALVGAAKICETCHLPALAINAEEYLHLIGFVIEPRDTVVVLAPGPITHREQQAAEYALRQGAQVIVAHTSGDGAAWPAEAARLALPMAELAPWCRALVAMALTHKLASELSALIGSNPDRPEHVDLEYVLKLLYTTPLQGWL